MVKLKLDEKNHKYTVDDKRVPSVTEIVNRVIPRDFYADEWYLKRGTAMHRALALFLQGRLDEKTVDPRIRGKVEAGKKAVRELSLKKPYIIEQPMSHSIYNYAGKPDVLAGTILVDWKSSHDDSTEVQAGGYYLLLEGYGYKVKKIYEIVLNDNEKYKIYEYKPKRSKRLFLSCLTMYNFMKETK